MKRRILDDEAPIPHGVLDRHDRVAGSTRQTDVGFGKVDELLDRLIHLAGEEEGMIVTSPAPLGRRLAHHALHVLDRLAVPLVVEGGQVVRLAFPLVIDIGVAAGLPAGSGVHEESRWD